MAVRADLNDVPPGVPKIPYGTVNLDRIGVIEAAGGAWKRFQVTPNATRVILRGIVISAKSLRQMREFAFLNGAEPFWEGLSIGGVTGPTPGSRVASAPYLPRDQGAAVNASGTAGLLHVMLHPARTAEHGVFGADWARALGAHVMRVLKTVALTAHRATAVHQMLAARLRAWNGRPSVFTSHSVYSTVDV